MLLPNKYLNISQSLIGLSSLLLDIIDSTSYSIYDLWAEFKLTQNKYKENISFQKFILVLNTMYITGMISYNEKGDIFNENKTD